MKNIEKGIRRIKLELDRIEDGKSVLFTDDGDEIVLPNKILPKEIVEGDYLVLTVATDEAEKSKKEQSAKDILNEIMNPS
jgi:hypothetical protein